MMQVVSLLPQSRALPPSNRTPLHHLFAGTCREDGKRFPLQKTISNLLELASIKSYKRSAFVMKVRYR